MRFTRINHRIEVRVTPGWLALCFLKRFYARAHAHSPPWFEKFDDEFQSVSFTNVSGRALKSVQLYGGNDKTTFSSTVVNLAAGEEVELFLGAVLRGRTSTHDLRFFLRWRNSETGWAMWPVVW